MCGCRLVAFNHSGMGSSSDIVAGHTHHASDKVRIKGNVLLTDPTDRPTNRCNFASIAAQFSVLASTKKGKAKGRSSGIKRKTRGSAAERENRGSSGPRSFAQLLADVSGLRLRVAGHKGSGSLQCWIFLRVCMLYVAGT